MHAACSHSPQNDLVTYYCITCIPSPLLVIKQLLMSTLATIDTVVVPLGFHTSTEISDVAVSSQRQKRHY